ncbi:MAG: hypothetical protein NZ901_09060 [Geminocystis sp.]|nr:hypothetical protein [Geminocystis sp.]HIK38113.1 hypothetical protein [Geminocystis sp. M7585_C2015_104]MCS7148323.1 hypothetical protein [Geminocystis sp.]MCX8077737.1 hypothetical protein [Geminocystis sp.]MDW8116629.1 hypothetical protein [Geminocystis sp.]
MFVILQKEGILSAESVCKNCLWATQNGSPRWQSGKLSCLECVGKSESSQLELYQCQMGFRLVNIP